ncbi:MAG: hypothetical protein ACRDU5_16430 [Mycobacterium sp.]
MGSKKVLRVGQTLQLEELPDGQWRAFYPLEDWSVTAPTRVEAFRQAAAELERRQQEPGYSERQRELAKQYLDNPLPGLEVEEMDETAYEQRMRDLPRLAEEIARNVPPDIRAAIDEGRA